MHFKTNREDAIGWTHQHKQNISHYNLRTSYFLYITNNKVNYTCKAFVSTQAPRRARAVLFSQVFFSENTHDCTGTCGIVEVGMSENIPLRINGSGQMAWVLKVPLIWRGGTSL